MRLSKIEYKELLATSHCKPRDEPKAKRSKRRKISALEIKISWQLTAEPGVEILKAQPCFEIVPGFERNGKKYQPIKYTADFLIEEDGKKIVVEVKSAGVLRANKKNYTMRRKLFLRAFPELGFREIIEDDDKRIIVKDY